MTQDEIIEMARQAGFWKDLFAYPEFKEHVEAFAKLVAAKEREICAQICENFSDTDSYDGGITTEYHAILIRQRGKA
jgi:hypothetical protein